MIMVKTKLYDQRFLFVISEAENSFYITRQFKWNIIEFYFLDENKLQNLLDEFNLPFILYLRQRI